jgi:hypothetical protein
MFTWLKKLFSFGTKDGLFLIKKSVRLVVYLVIKNNPQYAIPVTAVITGVQLLIKSKAPAEVIHAAIDKGLTELAEKTSADPMIQAEIKDLSQLIQVNIEPLPADEQFAKFQEVINAFETGLSAATK